MTEQEAIFYLKNRSCTDCSYGCESALNCKCIECELKEATQEAINSLKKQVPMKPECIEDKMWECGRCGNNLLFKWSRYPDILMPKEAGGTYCMNCGQRIDWTVIDLLESGEVDG